MANKFPDIFDDSSEMSELELMLARTNMRYIAQSTEERLSPDTYGCERLFLKHFLTPDMEDDFPLIAKDFFEHEFINIPQYYELKFVPDDPCMSWPEQSARYLILNLMMNAVKKGSKYATDLFCNLHKTYYKSEYKQLKRFQKISASEIVAVMDDGNKYHFGPTSMARVLTMAKMYGIEIQEDCARLYLYLDEEADSYFPERDEFFQISDAYDNAREQLNNLFETEEDMYKYENKAQKYVANVLAYFGYPEDFIDLCDDEFYGTEDGFTKAIAMFNQTFPNEEIKKEQVPFLHIIIHCISALQSTCQFLYEDAKWAIGISDGDFYDHFPPLFDPTKMGGLNQKVSPPKKSEPQVISQNNSQNYGEADLLAEIERLRTQLHVKESESKHYKMQLSDINRKLEEQKTASQRLEKEHDELIALRDHLYHQTEWDTEAVDSIDVESMKAAIKDKKIVIVGGNDNWVKKVKKEFPDWKFISPNASGAIGSIRLAGVDKLYFFTDTLGHSNYYKYIQLVREQNIPFGYIHGVNIENNILQIYQEMS